MSHFTHLKNKKIIHLPLYKQDEKYMGYGMVFKRDEERWVKGTSGTQKSIKMASDTIILLDDGRFMKVVFY